MILVNDILLLHEFSIKDYGGASGIRDLALLESAIARPFQTFGGEDLYPAVIDKAAALAESLIINHPFVDGNKRTRLAAMYSFLLAGHIILTASDNDLYNFIIDVSTGTLAFEEIVNWLKANSTQLP